MPVTDRLSESLTQRRCYMPSPVTPAAPRPRRGRPPAPAAAARREQVVRVSAANPAKSVRWIANTIGISKSHVARILSADNPAKPRPKGRRRKIGPNMGQAIAAKLEARRRPNGTIPESHLRHWAKIFKVSASTIRRLLVRDKTPF